MSGAAASEKPGRRPLRQSPSSVNWLITSADAAASNTDKLNFPASSEKIRRLAAFSASCSASASVSPPATPR